MAQQLNVNVYQINNADPIALGQVTKMGFPSAGVLLRSANNPSTGTVGPYLSSGVYVYGVIQVISTGTQYYTSETESVLVTLSNA